MCPVQLRTRGNFSQFNFDDSVLQGAGCDSPTQVPKGVYSSFIPINDTILDNDFSDFMNYINKHCKDSSTTKKNKLVKPEEKLHKNKSNKILKILFIVLFFLIIGGTGFYFYKK